MLFAALMCCVVSLLAQQIKNEPKESQYLKDRIQHVQQLNRYENSFTQKLDSVTGEEIRFLYEYDNHLNCTKEMRYYPSNNSWYLDQSFEYTYDELNRLTSVTHQQLSSIYKIEYTYNEQSLIVEEIYSSPLSDGWEPYDKGTYEYDEDGNLTLFIGYNYFDGWIETVKKVYGYENGLLKTELYYDFVEGYLEPHYKTDYHYNAQGLCTQVISNIWRDEWYLVYKTEYAFNGQGLCTEMTYYDYTSNGEWSGDGRYVFEYDTEGHLLSMISFTQPIDSQVWNHNFKTDFSYDDYYNCTTYNMYYFYAGDWHIVDSYEMTYDPSLDINQIAGLNRFWDVMEIGGPILNRVELNIPVYSKLLQIKVLGYEEEVDLIDCHYSEFNSLNIPTESHITVWPNPAKDKVVIEDIEPAEVQVYNALGQLVKTLCETNEIDVSGLAVGVYLVRVTTINGNVFTNRLIIH